MAQTAKDNHVLLLNDSFGSDPKFAFIQSEKKPKQNIKKLKKIKRTNPIKQKSNPSKF